MTNADKFKSLFGLYATELWAMPEKDFLKWLNSEAMNCSEFPNNSDTISRQAAIETLRANYPDTCFEQLRCAVDMAIKALEEPQRKKGKWIERNPQNSDTCRLIECDQCGFSHIVGFNVPYEHWIENRNFCERCGADMRGEQE